MTRISGSPPQLLAHHLYDFAECEHRVALDARLDRSLRTAPDAAMELLFERGRAFEREVVEALGYPAVEVVNGDWEGAVARTVALMREGVAGIDQGVLIDGARLARPDLLERMPGESRLGAFHYRPGDVKSAVTARSDAALQVAFAALLLEAVQGVRPDSGFLVLGDGRREEFDLESIRFTVDDAVARAEAVSSGTAETAASFDESCARCRWRGTCLPELVARRDVSFVPGVSRTRARLLREHGVRSIDDLAAVDLAMLAREGVPTDGLARAQAHARALLAGRVTERRSVPIPRGVRREAYLRIETDPLEHGAPFLFALAGGPANGGALAEREVTIASTEAARREAFEAIVGVLESPALAGEPVYVYGGRTRAAFDALSEQAWLAPARAGDLAGRFVDLAPWVRRAAILPVNRYRFREVLAVVQGVPRPAPADPEDASFVLHAGLRGCADPAPVLASLREAGLASLDGLCALRNWVAHPGTARR